MKAANLQTTGNPDGNAMGDLECSGKKTCKVGRSSVEG